MSEERTKTDVGRDMAGNPIDTEALVIFMEELGLSIVSFEDLRQEDQNATGFLRLLNTLLEPEITAHPAEGARVKDFLLLLNQAITQGQKVRALRREQGH